MVTIDELRKLDTSKFTNAAKAWGAISNRASAAKRRVDSEMIAKVGETQKGEAAQAAIKSLKRLSDNYQYIHAECGLIRTALDGLAQDLAAPQRKLKLALEDAAQRKFTVGADGSVEYPRVSFDKLPAPALQQPAQGGGLMLQADPNAAKAQEIADHIASALREAAEIDGRYAGALGKLTTNGDLSKTDWADVAADMKSVQGANRSLAQELNDRKKKSPYENAEWWKKLPQDRKDELIAAFPDKVGNLDGIPSAVRDQANREYLPALMGKLEAQGDEDSMTKLEGLRGIDEKLRENKGGPIFLLGIGDEGNGRAIVSYGNPDTAKNVSAYVPGLGTKLDGDFADGTVKRAMQTAKGARRYEKSTASIVWLGYDAPLMGPDKWLKNFDVAGEENAEKGAPAYDSFLKGIRATNENNHPHVTAIGHSYGSLTVGKASQEPGGIPADDIVLLGSPGTGVDKAEDLGVGKDHVYVGAAENDMVSKLPSKKDAVIGTIGTVGLGPFGGWAATELLGDEKNWFGTDPANADFGAHRFKVADGPSVFHKNPMAAHSGYFDPDRDRESANNIALVVSGHGDKITTQEHR
ncbi:alpha/beta hydrolase [Streptomyces caatingaensis]|uniref:DUF1023 domain-containing protein n=1 Tax=Streptomyces caatingaensis TaxID=1678637 RepID=A0A0K9X8G3_9ACTN|nr:alpha/beta hydrolase [Streptomyces caatingaensis]KNB49391.1 hypothetical protein AC230_29480 [Streptomyces caatingaensis]